jgi:hypothetical protein
LHMYPALWYKTLIVVALERRQSNAREEEE